MNSRVRNVADVLVAIVLFSLYVSPVAFVWALIQIAVPVGFGFLAKAIVGIL